MALLLPFQSFTVTGEELLSGEGNSQAELESLGNEASCFLLYRGGHVHS